jgi:hypothetical protein
MRERERELGLGDLFFLLRRFFSFFFYAMIHLSISKTPGVVVESVLMVLP